MSFAHACTHLLALPEVSTVPPLTPALQKIAGLRASSYRSDDLTNARVRLDWYNDISGDFSQVKITYTHNREDRTEIIPRKDGPKGDQSHAITGLLTGTRYTFTVQTMDSAGNTGPGASIGVNTPDTLDLTPPGVVSNLTAVGTDKGATLKWDNPSDFDHVEVMYWSPGDDASTIYDVGIVDTYVVSGLINPVGTEPYQWQFSVRTVDTSGNASRWVQAWAKLIDRDPPRQVSGLRAVPSYGKVTLYWRDPFDSDFAYAEIYVEKTSPTPGVMVHDWHDVGRSTNSYGSNSKEYTGLTNDSEYTFTIRTYDTSGNVDTAAQLSIKATPFDDIPPGEVRNLQITTGETEVVLTWLNPTDADFDHVVITRTLLPFGPTTTSIIPSTPSTSLSHRSSGMITGKDYRFIVQTVDRDGNTSIGLYREVTPRDLTPPGEVTYLSVTFNIITYILEEVVHEYPGGRLDIYWTPPTDRDFDHVLITVWRGGTKLFSVNGTTRDSTGRYLGEAYNVRGQYTVLIQTVDRDGNKSSGLTRVVGQ
ncbi:hypothetical protein AGMMS49944_29690 [Spirochaetia bacterium]|nr:hypothetical protein AGMMS49944_29690 [Spirochaetia bacterium]